MWLALLSGAAGLRMGVHSTDDTPQQVAKAAFQGGASLDAAGYHLPASGADVLRTPQANPAPVRDKEPQKSFLLRICAGAYQLTQHWYAAESARVIYPAFRIRELIYPFHFFW